MVKLKLKAILGWYMDFRTNNWLCLTDNLRRTGQIIIWRRILRAMICFIFLVCLFSFCLVWFVFFLLSCPVWVESACKGCNKICFAPSQWWFYDREENQKRQCFSYGCLISSCSSLQIQLWPEQYMASLLMKLVVDCEGKFFLLSYWDFLFLCQC